MNTTNEMREALTACVDAMLHNGVPTDKAHPARIALDKAESALARIGEDAATVAIPRYIVIGYGETDHPQAAFVNEREQLLDAVLGMMYTSPADADYEIRDAYRKDLADDDEWSNEGIWSAEFEIGGITIYDLGEPVEQRATDKRIGEDAANGATKFKEALHDHFNEFPIPTQLGVVAIMKHIDKVYAKVSEASRANGAIGEREAFEAWARNEFNIDTGTPLFREGKGYMGLAINAAWRAWRGSWQARAALTAAQRTVPEGWRLVPVEPTEAMMLQGSTCKHHAPFDMSCSARENRMRIYRAMLAAAPTAAPEKGDGRDALESALRQIADQEHIELMLDPTWAQRIAIAALSQKAGEQQ